MASGSRSVVSGGAVNTASGDLAAVSSGGQGNTASGGVSAVSGGHSAVSGGLLNTASGGHSVVSGGHSVVSGGQNITQETEFGWSAGSEADEVVVGNFRSP
jgi:trimeric autotransporter adhesin